MKVIAITGTFPAGKGTAVEHLVSKYGFVHFSVSDFIKDEIVKRKMKINRDSMQLVGNDLREKNGADYIVAELYRKAVPAAYIRVVIESIRNIAEINFLKCKLGRNFKLLAIDATQKDRYERAYKRKSAKDLVTWEEFCEGEAREMHSTDTNSQNISACMARADWPINNNGTEKEMNRMIDHYLKEFL